MAKSYNELNVIAVGCASAVVLAVLTILLAALSYGGIREIGMMLSTLFIGYNPTILGILIGVGWALGYGFVFGWIFGFVYNKSQKCKIFGKK